MFTQLNICFFSSFNPELFILKVLIFKEVAEEGDVTFFQIKQRGKPHIHHDLIQNV